MTVVVGLAVRDAMMCLGSETRGVMFMHDNVKCDRCDQWVPAFRGSFLIPVHERPAMPVSALITDDKLLRMDASPSGGTTFERHEITCLVTGAADKAAAEKEAKWRSYRDADGYVERQRHLYTSDPDWAGNYLVTYEVETTREW